MNPERMKKIDQLERVKLMDILEVDEETLIKFFKRLSDFKSSTWELFARKDSLARQVQKFLASDNTSDEKIAETIDELSAADKKMFQLKTEFLKETKELLPTRELAKFILFEQRFRRELMKAFEKKKYQKKYRMEKAE
jgi:hypothetical protein